MSNVEYAYNKLDHFVSKNKFHIQINGVDHLSLTSNDGWVDMLENAPDINLDPENGDLNSSFVKMKSMFPNAFVYKYNQIYDRAGKLDELKVFTNRIAIDKMFDIKDKKVIGCTGGIQHRSRTNEWVHINANGDIFLCCDDFDFVTIYGNLKEKSLEELWFSKERQDSISNAQNSICRNCSAAVWA